MFLQSCTLHFIARHAEAGASGSLKSVLEEFPMQHCNRQQAESHSQVATGLVARRLHFQPALLCLANELGFIVGLAERDLAK